MSPLFVVLVSLLLEPRYQARVLTYGCNSSVEVTELQKVRSDAEAFQKLLLAQIAYGQCIGIGKGTVVEGTIEQTDRSILRIEARNSPPGYMVPVGNSGGSRKAGELVGAGVYEGVLAVPPAAPMVPHQARPPPAARLRPTT